MHAMGDLSKRKNLMLGYPVNMSDPPLQFMRWREELANVGLGRFAFNNVGNPWEVGHFDFQTHPLERELIARFGALYHFDPKDLWGFLSNSGTDSNMHGLYMGRTILQGRTGVRPDIYFTGEAHYSVQILADLLGLKWVRVNALPDGSMDPASLQDRLDAHPNTPALVCATIGTTFKGAIDPIDEINRVLRGRESYLHLDAALFGGYLPQTRFGSLLWQATPQHPHRYDSIAVSCHKFFGLPSPAGIFVSTLQNFRQFHAIFSAVHDPAYILHVPGTITCSRDAVKVAEFHFYSSEDDFKRQRRDAAEMLERTDALYDQLNSRFPELRPMRASSMSNTIHFRRPHDSIIEKYTLATMDVMIDGEARPSAHVVVMPHVTEDVLREFLDDISDTMR
jgi:histidine decarboxylase